MPPESCPNCGADVPRNAKVCPECGADENSGWSDNAYANRLSLPDEDEFNHEEFVKEEFGGGERKPLGISWFWWVTAVLLVGLLLYLFLR